MAGVRFDGVENNDFWTAYDEMSQQGKCDAPGSMEYRRVLQEWLAVGKPRPIKPFIYVIANFGVGLEELN